MSKFLDSNGLLYLWGKIKVLMAGKVDTVSGKGLSANDYTDTEKTKLAGIATSANNYTHPTTTGNKHVPAGGASGQILRWSADGTAVWGADSNTTYAVATTTANGLLSSTDKSKLDGIAADANNYTHPTTTGNKHVPAGGVSGQFLKWSADGTAVWAADNNTTYAVATQSANGLLSSTDKTKLDGFAAATSYALKTEIAGVYKYKGTKTTYAGLPTTGNTTGDVWDVSADGMNYAWTGTAWDALGATFTVVEITNAEIDTILAS